MPTTEEELDRFTRFARERLTHGLPRLSLDELFDLWRHENPSDSRHNENVSAVAAAITDFYKGDRGTPAGEHSNELRREFGLDGE